MPFAPLFSLADANTSDSLASRHRNLGEVSENRAEKLIKKFEPSVKNIKHTRDLYRRYFDYRGVNREPSGKSSLPESIRRILPVNYDARILDIGCGYGHFLQALRTEGFRDLYGVDVSDEAVAHCVANGLNVRAIRDLCDFCEKNRSKFDFVNMSHVLEHIEKSDTIRVLRSVHVSLADGGRLCVSVPNAQSNTGAYWMYEDFTHETLFTAGSLLFVLRAAGYSNIEFLDPHGITDTRLILRPIKTLFLQLYKANYCFWNKVTSSSFHDPSPAIFTFELKACAR